MKTPDEIKKGLYHCGTMDVGCTGCPYDGECCNQGSDVTPECDALAYIQQLEEKLKAYEWYEGERADEDS